MGPRMGYWAEMNEKELQRLAKQIYLAKMCGFYANPESTCELRAPSFSQCIEDAAFALEALARNCRGGLASAMANSESTYHVNMAS